MDMWAFAASALIFSRSADAMRVLNLISFFTFFSNQNRFLKPNESPAKRVSFGEEAQGSGVEEYMASHVFRTERTLR